MRVCRDGITAVLNNKFEQATKTLDHVDKVIKAHQPALNVNFEAPDHGGKKKSKKSNRYGFDYSDEEEEKAKAPP